MKRSSNRTIRTPEKYDVYNINVALPKKHVNENTHKRGALLNKTRSESLNPLPIKARRITAPTANQDSARVEKANVHKEPIVDAADTQEADETISTESADEQHDAGLETYRGSVPKPRPAVPFKKTSKSVVYGGLDWMFDESQVLYDIANDVYIDAVMNIYGGSFGVVIQSFQRAGLNGNDKKVQSFFVDRAKCTVLGWTVNDLKNYHSNFQPSARWNHLQRASEKVLSFVWLTAKSWTLRKNNLPTYKEFLPVLKTNLMSLQQILSSSSLLIRSLPFMNILFIRCTLIYIRVHYENDVFEQISSAFSPELAAGKTMDIISSLSTAEGCFNFVFHRLKDKLIDLRKEFVDKWDTSNQENSLFQSRVDVTDIEELCTNSSEFVFSMNRLLPLAHMVSETCQGRLADMLNGKHKALFDGKEYDDANKKETVLTFLSYARKLVLSNSRDINQEAGLRAISAMVFSCEYGVEGHRAVARVLQAELFSFLKVIIANDMKFTNALLQVHKIGIAKTPTFSGLLHDDWWDASETSVGNQVIAPTVFISLLGGDRLLNFDNAFNLALKDIIV